MPLPYFYQKKDLSELSALTGLLYLVFSREGYCNVFIKKEPITFLKSFLSLIDFQLGLLHNKPVQVMILNQEK